MKTNGCVACKGTLYQPSAFFCIRIVVCTKPEENRNCISSAQLLSIIHSKTTRYWWVFITGVFDRLLFIFMEYPFIDTIKCLIFMIVWLVGHNIHLCLDVISFYSHVHLFNKILWSRFIQYNRLIKEGITIWFLLADLVSMIYFRWLCFGVFLLKFCLAFFPSIF